MADYKSNNAWEATRLAKSDPGPSPAAERQSQDYELGDVRLQGHSQPPPRRRGGAAPWLLASLVTGAAAAFVALAYLPLRDEVARLGGELETLRAERQQLAVQVETLSRDKAALETKEAELAQTVQAKDEALAELTRAQEELAQQLDAEIKKGDILIKQRGGELVVDVSDQILFDSGAAELNEQGKNVLLRVGEIFVKSKDKVVQVGGHTDDVPMSQKLMDKYPTNWELSAARATHVVRFLQESAKIPGHRLVAAGFSQYRPAASNVTKTGRRKNRRIEVVLLPKAK